MKKPKNLKKWNIAYKRVYKVNKGRYYSAHAYIFRSLRMEYKFGYVSSAKVGGLFCFRTLRDAQASGDGNCILRVLAKSRIKLPRQKLISALTSEKAKKIWLDNSKPSLDWSCGTVAYRKILPIEELI